MAELILTKEEKAAASFLLWTDEALGKAVRSIASKLQDFTPEKYRAIPAMGACLCLVDRCLEANAEEFTTTLIGFTSGDRDEGDWEIVCRRVRKPKGAAC